MNTKEKEPGSLPYLDESGGKIYRYPEVNKFNLDKDSHREIHEAVYYRYEVYPTREITKSSNYAGLCALLREGHPLDVFNFYLANYGGCCHSLINLINAILDSPSFVHMHVTSPTYSAGSTLALCGDSLNFRAYSYLMFHNYSSVAEGKGRELLDSVEASDKWIKDYMNNLHRPFLTKKECARIDTDGDIRIWYNEKDLEERLVRHFK